MTITRAIFCFLAACIAGIGGLSDPFLWVPYAAIMGAVTAWIF